MSRATVTYFDGLSTLHGMRVPAGVQIHSLADPSQPVTVRLNGAYLLRRDWGHRLAAGDHLEVAYVVNGGNNGRKALRTALVVIAMAAGQGWAAQALLSTGAALGSFGTYYALIQMAAVVAGNLLLPDKLPNVGGAGDISTSPSYQLALAGNRAQLDEAIPVIYGRQRIYPPFAGQPYTTYEDEDQYYNAVFCLGMGHYTVERLLIDDTPLAHFADAQWLIVPPGTGVRLQIVSAAVMSAIEVSGQELDAGRAVGPFAACPSRVTVIAVEYDIAFERGLGNATGIPVTEYSVGVRVDVRRVDDFGSPLSAWEVLATHTVTAALTSPVRRTYRTELPSTARWEVRLIRTTTRDDNPLILNDALWAGLRGYASTEAPLADDATYLELRIRATAQLNGITQSRIAAVLRRKLNTWHPDTGWTTTPVETRNPAWALADKWTHTVYGDRLTDAQIDLAGLYALAQTYDDRQDRLDIVFDSATDSESADQTMARAGRARAVWRHGVRTLARDERQDVPVTAYTSRDIVPGSASIAYDVDAQAMPDAMVVEFMDGRSWTWRTVEAFAPGRWPPDVVGPLPEGDAYASRMQYMRLFGVTGATHAGREALYEMAARYYRRARVSLQTELQGLLPAYGAAVVVAPALTNWDAAGDVTGWSLGSLTLTLSEPPVFTDGTHQVSLVRDDGSLTPAITCTPGPDAYTVVLAGAPDFDPIVDAADRERTRYLFGASTVHRRLARVIGITPEAVSDDGVLTVQVLTVLENDLVHQADESLLPVGEEIQDDVDVDPTPDPGEDGYVVYLSSMGLGVSGDAYPLPESDYRTTVTVSPNGALTYTGQGAPSTPTQWLIGNPFDPAPGDQFEVRMSYALLGSYTDAGITGTLDTWQALDVARVWVFGPPPPWNVLLQYGGTSTLEIRRISGGIGEATASLTFTLGFSGLP